MPNSGPVAEPKPLAETKPKPMELAEAIARISRACTLGNITGTDAMQIQRALEDKGDVGDEVAAFLRGVS